MRHVWKTGFQILTAVAAVTALTSATYAWFTTNRQVSTSTASARTGTESLTLEISSSGGSAFRNQSNAPITQVNEADASKLLPVSTADLVNFVYSPSTVNDQAVHFEKLDRERYYYHGRIYLRAAGEGFSSGSRLELYLDQSDGFLGEAADGQLLSASRLGLVFDEDPASARILRLTETESPASEQVYNTVIDGRTLGKDQVLSWNGTGVSPTADPSVPVTDYTAAFTSDGLDLPEQPLFTMELGVIYPLDVYFYLEGCDPDCSDSVSYDGADIHLAFYGVLSEEDSR